MQFFIRKFINNKLVLISLLVFSCLYLIQSTYYLPRYLNHIDDSLVPLVYQEKKIEERIDKCIQIFEKNTLASYQKIIAGVCEFVTRYLSIPLSTTYPPSQFVISSIIIEGMGTNNLDLGEKLTITRSVSFLFLIAGAVIYGVTLVVFSRAENSSKLALFGLALILVLMPLQNRFYSYQSGPYAASYFSVGILFLSYYYFKYKGDLTFLRIVGFSIVSAFAISFSYMTALVVVPLAILLIKRRNDESLIDSLKKYGVFFASSALFSFMYLPFLIRSLISFESPGVTWNKGIDNIFFFSFNSEQGVIDNFLHFLNVSIVNLPYVLGTLSSFFESTKEVYYIIGLLILSVTFWLVLRANDQISKEIRFVLIFLTFEVILLQFFGLITLSPTRHMMFYVATILMAVLIMMSRKEIFNSLKTFYLFILISIVSMGLYSDVLSKRQSNYEEVKKILLNHSGDLPVLMDRKYIFPKLRKNLLKNTFYHKENYCPGDAFPESLFLITSHREKKGGIIRICADTDFLLIQDLSIQYSYKSISQVGLSNQIYNSHNELNLYKLTLKGSE